MLQFGEIIRKKREEKGWTQKQLAQKLYVSDKAISRWENNQSYPDITLLLEIAKVLELDYQELIEGNQYIVNKQRKRKKTILMILILVLSFIGIGITDNVYKQNQNKITERGLDFFVSKKWDTVFYSHEDGASSRLYLSDYEKEAILEFFDVDHLVKVGNDLSIDWIYNFSVSKEDVITNFYVYQKEDRYYLYMPTYHKDYVTGVTYLSDKDISDFKSFFESLSRYDYDYGHIIENHTKLRLLSKQEVMDLKVDPIRDLADTPVTIRLIETTSKKYYLSISSNQADITRMDIDEDTLLLQGELRSYSKPYLCVYEISTENIKKAIFNGENILVSRIEIMEDLR